MSLVEDVEPSSIASYNPKKFVTKDSGARQTFGGGMKRDTAAGKIRPDLIKDGPMYLRWVQLLTRGAVKYDPGNWMKATGQAEYDRFLESADRHYFIWYMWRKYGINLEDDSNPTTLPLTEDHAAAVYFNINGAEYCADQKKAIEASAERLRESDGAAPVSEVRSAGLVSGSQDWTQVHLH